MVSDWSVSTLTLNNSGDVKLTVIYFVMIIY